MRKLGVIAAAAAASIVLSAGSASSAPVAHATCSWGASSITAEVVNGQVVASQPVRTGCAP
jgi:hypothetical protein